MTPFEDGTSLADINHQLTAEKTNSPSRVLMVCTLWTISVCLVIWCIWLHETNQMNKTDQMNQINLRPSRQSRVPQ